LLGCWGFTWVMSPAWSSCVDLHNTWQLLPHGLAAGSTYCEVCQPA
jgi:hypothetical protein